VLRRYAALVCAVGCLAIVALLVASGAQLLWLVLGVAISAAAVFGIWELATRGIVDPIERLGSRTEAVADGETLQVIEAPSDPGLARIVDNFNALTVRIRKESAALTEARHLAENLNALEERSLDLEARYSNTIALSEIGQKITSSLNLDDILQTTYESINSMMDAAMFGLGTVDADGSVLHFNLSIEKGNRLAPFTVSIDEPDSLAAWAARNRRDVFLNDVERDHTRYVSGLKLLGGSRIPRSAIFSPMSVGERLVGVICVQSYRGDAYTEHHLNMIRTLASYTAVAHDHAHAYNELDKAHRDLQEAQLQLVQSEKMASLGQLTAGIAHEINNPINFVSANVNPLQRDLNDLLRLLRRYEEVDASDGVAAKLAEIQQLREEIDVDYVIEEMGQLLKGIAEGAGRTTEIVRGLRNFSRVDESELKRADIHEGLDSTLVLLHSMYKGRIEIVKEYDALPDIECYPGQLNQVFMNLINNAVQAIPAEGRVTVGTRRIGDLVEVTIADTGAGIPDAIRQKIFDPFFTTKEVGKGTGLGLSISIGIIQKHNGTIAVESEVGKGTTFIVTLPIAQNRD